MYSDPSERAAEPLAQAERAADAAEHAEVQTAADSAAPVSREPVNLVVTRPARPWKLPLLLLALILIAGSAARLSYLGQLEFMTDELDHHYAAQSLGRGDGPLLPSGEPYMRGVEVSRLVSIAQRFVKDPEAAARLPSALFGVLNLLLMAGIAWLLAGPWAAVWATALLAIYPEMLLQSKTSRFYTYQLSFGLLAMYFGWLAARPPPAVDRAGWRRSARTWIWTAMTLVLFFAATKVQITTLSAAVAWAIWFALIGLLAVLVRGRSALLHSTQLQVSVLGAIGAIAFLVINPHLPAEVWRAARFVPHWAGGAPGPVLFYYYGMADDFGWILSFLPVLVIIAWRRRPWLAAFLAFWFFVPMAIHSFLLPWKGARFVILAMPALFLIVGIAASDLLGMLRSALVRSFRNLHFSLTSSPRLADALVGICGFTALVTLPAFASYRMYLRGELPERTPNWRAVAAVLAETPEADRYPVGSSDPVSSLFYWNRADFGVQIGLLDNGVRPAAHHPELRFPPASDSLMRDLYVGVPIVVTPESVRQNYQRYGAVIIGVDLMRISQGNVNRALVDTLQRSALELCGGRCGDMRLYLWPLSR